MVERFEGTVKKKKKEKPFQKTQKKKKKNETDVLIYQVLDIKKKHVWEMGDSLKLFKGSS